MGSFYIFHTIMVIAFAVPFSDWFHGDIYSITLENINNLIGLKCHKCRQRNVPVCPYAETDAILKAQSDEDHNISKFVVDKWPSFSEETSALGNQTELHGCNIEKRLNGHVTAKELNGELHDHRSLNEVVSHSVDQELDARNNMEGLVSFGFKNEFDDQRLKDLDNQNNLEKHDNYMTEKELNNHNCVNELDVHNNNLKELDGQNNGEELDGTQSSKFAAKETQCLKPLDSFNGLILDSCNIVEKLGNHNCPKESDNHSSSIALDANRSPKFDSTDDSKLASATTHSSDFLAEHLSNIRISSKEALVKTSETGSVKESRDVQSKDDSEKSVPPDHKVDIPVLVIL
jgi:hypothetical protein